MAPFKNKKSKIAHPAMTPAACNSQVTKAGNTGATGTLLLRILINVGAFSTCVMIWGGWFVVVNGLILEMRNTFDETGHLFRMCLCSAPGGEWESGRKFCQTVSKF